MNSKSVVRLVESTAESTVRHNYCVRSLHGTDRHPTRILSVVNFSSSSPSCEDITRVTDDCKSSKHKAEIKPDTECAPVKQEPITASSASMNQSETTLKIGHEQEPVTSGSGIVVPPKSMHCQVCRRGQNRCAGF